MSASDHKTENERLQVILGKIFSIASEHIPRLPAADNINCVESKNAIVALLVHDELGVPKKYVEAWASISGTLQKHVVTETLPVELSDLHHAMNVVEARLRVMLKLASELCEEIADKQNNWRDLVEENTRLIKRIRQLEGEKAEN